MRRLDSSLKRRGFSVTEVLISAFLFSIVMSTAYQTWAVMNKARVSQEAKMDARRQVREFMNDLTRDIHGASYIYAGYSGSMGSFNYSTKPVPSVGSTSGGYTLIYAIPEAPAYAFGGSSASSLTFTVVGIYPSIMASSSRDYDPLTTNVYQLNMERFPGVLCINGAGNQAEQASNLNLSSLSTSWVSSTTGAKYESHVFNLHAATTTTTPVASSTAKYVSVNQGLGGSGTIGPLFYLEKDSPTATTSHSVIFECMFERYPLAASKTNELEIEHFFTQMTYRVF